MCHAADESPGNGTRLQPDWIRARHLSHGLASFAYVGGALVSTAWRYKAAFLNSALGTGFACGQGMEDTMTMKTYRAAVLVSEDRQDETVLTTPAHAGLSDEQLVAEARAELVRAGVGQGDASIEIMLWRI